MKSGNEKMTAASDLGNRFLEAETRAGYRVDARMKKVWKCQLEIVEEFQRICRAHGLRYYALGGTLIGAVRHKGYVPWDDDIDFAMMRDHYDLFCQYARKELKQPYFLQTMETDEWYYDKFAKIRNSQTTQITAWAREHRIRCNQGICIDIFPLDGVAAPGILKIQKRLAMYLSHARAVAHYGMRAGVLGKTKGFFYSLFYRVFGNVLISRAHEAIFRMFRNGVDNWVCPQALNPFRKETQWRKEWFSETCECPFEYLSVTIPKEYEKILTHQFGDWRKPVQGRCYHTELFFDAEKPYVEYLRQWGFLSEKENCETHGDSEEIQN